MKRIALFRRRNVLGLVIILALTGGGIAYAYNSEQQENRNRYRGTFENRDRGDVSSNTDQPAVESINTETKPQASDQTNPLQPKPVTHYEPTPGNLRFRGGPYPPAPPVLPKIIDYKNPTNCETFTVNAQLGASEDATLIYHWEFSQGFRSPSKQLSFKKGEVKTVHVEIPYEVEPTARMIKGVLTLVLESPVYWVSNNDLYEGLYHICHTNPDNPLYQGNP